ncbi:hypothetical protein [Mameliella sp.]|uniref:hypothetical protein n=1 Tax=Mameliella sp. TaxID=1924940 RepID=UPI003BA92D47
MSDDLKERLRMMPTYSGDPKGPHWVPNLAADRIADLEAQLAEAQADMGDTLVKAYHRGYDKGIADRDAAVAAALEEAAAIAHIDGPGTPMNTGTARRMVAADIRALIPQDGADALAQARADGMREAAELFTAHPWSWNAKEIQSRILAAIEKGEG